jgi:transposase
MTVSPLHKRLGLYFSMSPHNVTGDAVLTFVQRLRRHLKRPLLLIWDRFSGYKKAARLLSDRDRHRIHEEFLPAYAPELNVVYYALGHIKYGEMANFIPQDVDDMAEEVACSLIAKHTRQDLKAFFQHARLEL